VGEGIAPNEVQACIVPTSGRRPRTRRNPIRVYPAISPKTLGLRHLMQGLAAACACRRGKCRASPLRKVSALAGELTATGGVQPRLGRPLSTAKNNFCLFWP
jgi:hypothetical protein